MGLNFFQNPVMSDDVIPYPVHVNYKIFKIEKTSHVIYHSTPKALESSFLALLISFSLVVAAIVMVFKFYNHRENTWGTLITSSEPS